ncbi:MAG: MBOAT family protein [Deltaproteobacteria bacterium]|nr:MBOAT family protein [Deltaproteobacteria bacterium]
MTWVRLDILGWAALAVLLAWLPPRRTQPHAVAALTLVFLSIHAPLSAAILSLFALGSWALLAHENHPTQRLLLVVGAVVVTLVSFKLGARPQFPTDLGTAVVPLGLSYYGMRVIHYAVERYKGKLPEHRLDQYLCYLFFLPIIFAGPITGFPDFLRDLRRRRWDAAVFSRGIERVVSGYAKIVVLGNYAISIRFAQYINDNHPSGTPLGEYLDCLRFGSNLYIQFSGYSDIAIGLGLMMGFRIAENFRLPFLAANIGEFWQRWHMTLTGWCRSYIYLPVAAATRRPAAATVTAMLVLGIWHDVSMRFVLWGLYHGVGIVVWQRFRSIRPEIGDGVLSRITGRLLGTLITFQFVILSFALAKENTPAAAARVYTVLLTGWW